MYTLIITVHIIACISIILIVLLQAGKGAEMGAAFGGSSQTIFGSSGPGSFLEKLTAMAAVIFMLTSLTLAYFSTQRQSSSVIQEDSVPVEQDAPLIPASEGEK
ncbi:MAG: preprotein translocase subunit SecG [Thermodesulfobacteriota bacterium]|nr:preprotein translocase subunit SecG [Thermodesulfobacteriota bacterium]